MRAPGAGPRPDEKIMGNPAVQSSVPSTPAPEAVDRWVREVEALTQPARVHWCTGSDAEAAALTAELVKAGELLPLNAERFPRCYLYRSSPSDVARVEHLTFVCTKAEADAGPNNNWMAPDAAHAEDGRALQRRDARPHAVRRALLHGPGRLAVRALRRRDHRQPLRRAQHADDDAAWATPALARIARDGTFVRGLHSIGELDPERRFIMHFPEELSIKSFGSGYGGNALLGKKCHALRIASWQARTEGWLAEHMLLVGARQPRRARPTTSPPRSRRPAARPTSRCWCRRRRCRAGRSARSATTSPGCTRARTAGCGRSTRRPGTSASRRGPTEEQPQRLRHGPARHDLHQRRARREQ